ncbi:hypothetical protein AX774_g3579, partial [Zancudomyces culisetae]
MFDAGLIAIGN